MLGRANAWIERSLRAPQLHRGPTKVTPSAISITPFFVIVRPKDVCHSLTRFSYLVGFLVSER